MLDRANPTPSDTVYAVYLPYGLPGEALRRTQPLEKPWYAKCDEDANWELSVTI